MNLEKKVILLKLNTSIFKFPCIDNENVIKVVFIISEYIYIEREEIRTLENVWSFSRKSRKIESCKKFSKNCYQHWRI